MGKWRRVGSLSRRWQRGHLIAKYGSRCYICSQQIERMEQITFDHWVPLSKGGTDTLDNYRLAHEDCNRLKGAIMPDTFREFQGGLVRYE